MRVGFAGTPVRAFKALWTDRSAHRPEDLIEYSSSLRLRLLGFSEETLGLTARDLAEVDSMGLTAKQASHFRHLAQLAKVGGVRLVVSSSPRTILTAPDAQVRARSTAELSGLWTVAKALECVLLTIFPGYLHGSQQDSLERLTDSIVGLDRSVGDSLALGVELHGRGAGTAEVLERLCADTGVVPVINVAECIPRSERSEFAAKFASLLEFAERHSVQVDGQSCVWIRYRSLNKRVPVGVSEGWPDFRMVMREIFRFESSGGPEACLLLDSPRREWDAVLVSSCYRMLESRDGRVDSLSAEELVKSGSPRVVDVGCQVLLRDVSRSQQLRYEIVEPGLADPFSDRISYESPIGRSLLGKESGSLIEIAAPGGSYVYEVIDIR